MTVLETEDCFEVEPLPRGSKWELPKIWSPDIDPKEHRA